MCKLLNIGIDSVRLAISAYILVNVVAFFFVSTSVSDSQQFSISTKTRKGDCSFFICNENEKDGEDDDFKNQPSIQNIFSVQSLFVFITLSDSLSELLSFSDSSRIYLRNRSFLL